MDPEKATSSSQEGRTTPPSNGTSETVTPAAHGPPPSNLASKPDRGPPLATPGFSMSMPIPQTAPPTTRSFSQQSISAPQPILNTPQSRASDYFPPVVTPLAARTIISLDEPEMSSSTRPTSSVFDPRTRALAPLPPIPGNGIGSPVIHASPVQESSDLGRMNTAGSRSRSNVDWIVPLKERGPRTVEERLRPTITHAEEQKAKYEAKAKLTGLALNVAIGLQVLLGALTTGLSAVTSGRQTSITVSVLGGLSTLVASYLARARGSNEPELSIARVKDLEQFLRDALAYVMDFGHEHGHEHDEKLNAYRVRFEELLGNGDGQRKLSPPV